VFNAYWLVFHGLPAIFLFYYIIVDDLLKTVSVLCQVLTCEMCAFCCAYVYFWVLWHWNDVNNYPNFSTGKPNL